MIVGICFGISGCGAASDSEVSFCTSFGVSRPNAEPPAITRSENKRVLRICLGIFFLLLGLPLCDYLLRKM